MGSNLNVVNPLVASPLHQSQTPFEDDATAYELEKYLKHHVERVAVAYGRRVGDI